MRVLWKGHPFFVYMGGWVREILCISSLWGRAPMLYALFGGCLGE